MLMELIFFFVQKSDSFFHFAKFNIYENITIAYNALYLPSQNHEIKILSFVEEVQQI